jgi:hypothetical protein
MRPIAFVLVAAATMASIGAYTLHASKQTDGVAAPIFVTQIPPAYRDFRLISVAHEEGNLNSLGAVLGNDVATKAFREGTLPYPDGTIIAALHYSHSPSEENDRIFGQAQSFVPGLLTSLTLNTPYGALQWALILRGLGYGLAFQPLLVAALAEIAPRDLPSASSINTVVRFIAQSLGIAILATLVQSQTKVHYTHLAEQVTAGSPLAQFLTQLQEYFVTRGADIANAHIAAVQVIIRYVQLQSYMLALQDAFRLSLVLVIISIVATLFVRERRRTPTPVRETPGEDQNEEERARTEAALAV